MSSRVSRSATRAKAAGGRIASKSPARRNTAAAAAAAAAQSSDGAVTAATAAGTAAPPAEMNPTTHEFEFGGVGGASALLVVLPAVIYLLFFLCPNDTSHADVVCAKATDLGAIVPSVRAQFEKLTLDDFWSQNAVIVVIGWFLFQLALERLLPGEVVEGVTLRDGKRLKYKINGHLAFWVSLVVVACGNPNFQWNPDTAVYELKSLGNFNLMWCYDNYLQLATASMALSFAVSIYVYCDSFSAGEMLALGGNSGSKTYDFFIGRGLNPRFKMWPTFDIKEFCELKPGLIGWAVLNLGMAFAQHQKHGHVSLSMVAVNLFQGIYVWDALLNERAILTTMDITTDGFGYMLAFGDLSWVPFTYTLQARFLVDHDPALGVPAVCAIVLLNCLGFAIFRGANSEKDLFRRSPAAPECAHLQSMPTKRGTKLLISGWWGVARKINYTGDWIMGLSWCLVTGFNNTVTYFYAIYFAILLVHRSLRDNHACKEKYGADWDVYKKHVPYVFIPYVY